MNRPTVLGLQVVFIDTFHLFPETHDFLHQLEVCIPATFSPRLSYSQSQLSDWRTAASLMLSAHSLSPSPERSRLQGPGLPAGWL